jgi:hypothetical protein
MEGTMRFVVPIAGMQVRRTSKRIELQGHDKIIEEAFLSLKMSKSISICARKENKIIAEDN